MPPTGDEIREQVSRLGAQIAAAKKEGQPQSEWNALLQQMLALKLEYKTVTGEDYDPPKTTAKKESTPDAAASDKNKEKRAAKAAAKAAREAEKAAKRAERERLQREKAERLAGGDNYGILPLIQSKEVTGRTWTKIQELGPELAGQKVLIRGHLQTSRPQGRMVFALIRSSLYTVQTIASESDSVSKDMIKFIAGLPAESVVDVQGTVQAVETPIDSATQKLVEVVIDSFHCVSKVQAELPFVMEDACRPAAGPETDVGAYNEDEEEAVAADGLVRVGQKIRLDYRWLDLRTPANQAIFRIESMVGCLFREYLVKNGFVEIHTPKLIGGASEGGSEVFSLDYFGRPACLAMSPQLHKQMTAACSGFERVFETGPVFRAEQSNTRRHLCEFTGLDLEMVIHEHYNEVLDVMSELFVYIFDGINARCKDELERVREQHPFEDLKYSNPTLKLTYAEGCQLLRDSGIAQDDLEDLSTENEKKLGDLVKEKHGVDFFFLDKFPLCVRPFYTMPDPNNEKLSNSYDFFIRGQEIVSGAQRIHDPALLEERAKVHGISLDSIKAYIDSFRHGAMPHAGGGIGLERVVMLFLGLPNIRKSAWFPRDPKRLAP